MKKYSSKGIATAKKKNGKLNFLNKVEEKKTQCEKNKEQYIENHKQLKSLDMHHENYIRVTYKVKNCKRVNDHIFPNFE